ncbi:MAG: hypothetical protein AB7V42_12370 [Thermoleophilia bacterium]
MRRTPIALAAAAAAAVFAAPAAADLSISTATLSILSADNPDPARPQLVLRQGERYRFRVDYRVSGAAAIGTAHRFTVENAATGVGVAAVSKSFEPEPAGGYNEYSAITVGSEWQPGVYRVSYTVTARNTRLPSVETSGARVFLVVGPSPG